MSVDAAVIVSGLALVVAVYAAWTSARVHRWQKRRDEERREVRAHIEVAQELTTLSDVMQWGRAEAVDPRARLHLIVVNDSEQSAIFVEQIMVWEQGRGFGEVQRASDVRLEPRERHVEKLTFTGDQLRSLLNGFDVQARLASGEVVERRFELAEELLALARKARR